MAINEFQVPVLLTGASEIISNEELGCRTGPVCLNSYNGTECLCKARCMFCCRTLSAKEFRRLEVKADAWFDKFCDNFAFKSIEICCCFWCLPLFKQYVDNNNAPLIKEPEDN